MIGYSITEQELRELIEAEKPGWLERAQERTEGFLDAGGYDESSNIWSEIKAVYMALQHDKCGYCERQLAGGDFGGGIEHDIEHYRPKNTVPVWPSPAIAEERDIHFNFPTGDGLENGYFWLAYHPLNYCTACKKCNSPLKTNYFPIAAARGAVGQSPAELLLDEKPFLVYPLGDFDESPEAIITFDGILAIPVKKNGPRWRRAKVTIAFFELNRREELLRERAAQLVALDNALFIIESDAEEDRKEQAEGDIERLRSSSSPHASCVRAAGAAYIEDPARMRELFAAAREYLDSLG